jgi:hypothetical protein
VPVASRSKDWRPIGIGAERYEHAELVTSDLVIEGEDVANVAFDTFRMHSTKKGRQLLADVLRYGPGHPKRPELERVLAAARQELEKTLRKSVECGGETPAKRAGRAGEGPSAPPDRSH